MPFLRWGYGGVMQKNTGVPAWAMVFAAGLGTRMMPLTADRPKPMLSVLGKPLLGHALERVAQAGICQAIVNTHYCADSVREFIAVRKDALPHVTLSHEEKLLETGGGVKKALDEGLLPKDASSVLLVNSDVLLTDLAGQPSAIERMAVGWSRLGNAVDVLLLLAPRANAWGHENPKGDYAFEGEEGRLRRLANSPAPFVFAGMMIVRPKLYETAAFGEHFSNLKIMDAAQAKGRLFGVVHEGGWFHFSTPEALQRFHAERGKA